MITEQDLKEAIAECEGLRNPNANTCIKLAAFYTIRDHLYPKTIEDDFRGAVEPISYSMASEPLYENDTEFARAVQGWSAARLMPIMDELMSAVAVLNPRLYDSAMRKIIDG